jgi:hypothetical protein
MNVALTHWRDEKRAISLRPDGYERVRGAVSQRNLCALNREDAGPKSRRTGYSENAPKIPSLWKRKWAAA